MPALIAALPMYDWPELRAANDRLWAGISAKLRAVGIEAPHALERKETVFDVWRDPGLILGQTCGLPLVGSLSEHVEVIGTPHYDVYGCRGATYSSAIVVRFGETATGLTDFVGRRAAVNDHGSQSGMAALRHAFANYQDRGRVFASVVETGGHRASIRAVASGVADIAAIDAVCWHFSRAFEPAARNLRVLAWTRSVPGLPLIVARRRPAWEKATIRQILQTCFSGEDGHLADECRELRLSGFSALAMGDYAVLKDIAAADARAGYPGLV